MTNKIAILIDSSPSMPKKYLTQYPIHVVPNLVLWNGEHFKDWEDITQDLLFKRLEKGEKPWPTMATPGPAPFQRIYKKLLDEGHDVLVIFPPSDVSLGADSAREAKQAFPSEKIHVVETGQMGMVNGWAAIIAARAAEKGAGLKECGVLVKKLSKQGEYVGALDTLDYMYKGGRIGRASRMFGSTAGLKTIFEMRNNRIEGYTRVRTRAKALDKVMGYTKDLIPEGKKVYLAGMHAQAKDEIKELMARARETFEIVEEVIVPLPPSSCVHLGPGAIGLASVWID